MPLVKLGLDCWDKKRKTATFEQFRSTNKKMEQKRSPCIPVRMLLKEVFDVLEQNRGEDLHGIFHCFASTKTDAERALGYNLKLGIGGVVTFKNGK